MIPPPARSPSAGWQMWPIMLAAVVGGCAPAPSDTETPSGAAVREASYRNATPQQYLAEVFTRYRNAASYHDRGIVQLRYRGQGGVETRTAPLSVWLDHDRLYVTAYDVCLRHDVDAVTAWIIDPATENFDGQVLRRSAARGRPRLESLFCDTILAEKISAGLAGPPPQLDWLLAPEPMKHLFHASHEFRYEPSRRIDDLSCRIVCIAAGAEEYRFWIDQTSGVIRRVELPPISLPIPGATASQQASLSLELVGARFDRPHGQVDVRPIPENARYVGQFVPLPPAELPPLLGRPVPPFRVTDRQRQIVLTEAGSDRKLTIIVQLGQGVPAAALDELQRWHAALRPAVSDALRVVALAGHLPPDQRFASWKLPVLWDRQQSGSDALGLTPGWLVILDRRQRIAWTQPLAANGQPADLASLGAVVSDLLRGVDVPARLRKQWDESHRDYQRALDANAVVDN